MDSALYFIENLTLRTWGLSVWPRLLWARLHKERRVSRCYVFDGSPLAMCIAKVSAKVVGVAPEKLAFRVADVRDESGLPVWLRILYRDLAEVQQHAMALPPFQRLSQSGLLADRLPMFLAKKVASTDLTGQSTIWRALHVVEVCNWKTRLEGDKGSVPVLFLARRPWLEAVMPYSAQRGVTIVPTWPALALRTVLRRHLPPKVVNLFRFLRYRRLPRALSPFQAKPATGKPRDADDLGAGILVAGPGCRENQPKPRVGVECYGMLNLNYPARHSDLFFWQQSSLSGSDLLLTFSNPSQPLDAQKWAELKGHGIGAVPLHPGATTISEVPIFEHRHRTHRLERVQLQSGRKRPEGAWLGEQIAQYRSLRSFWTDLALTHNIKVYLTWFKYDATHCAIADAIQATGGVTAIYQRAYEAHPSAQTTIGADIVFGFSQAVAEIERCSNSSIRYHVTTGYLGDHRFSLVRRSAQTTREKLRQRGAQWILAYLDENTSEDPRWLPGHHVMQEDYGFLLEKVLSEPWLGLVIKPKVPGTLRRRLGPVAHLLEQAEATGRCYVYEGRNTPSLQSWHPPAEAALAADATVHSSLVSATAGMETALAGVPTLLLDREGWPESPLYRLGVGTVVFTNWQELWAACLQQRSTPGGVPGFGDWSPILDELDPFRDGRAAERMGTYVQWLIEGFQSSLGPETVMADAAERYCAKWGQDKITEVNGDLRPGKHPGVSGSSTKLLSGVPASHDSGRR